MRAPPSRSAGLDAASYYRHLPDGTLANDTGTGNCLDLAQPFMMRLAMDSLRYWATRIGVDGFRFDLAPTLTRGSDGGFEPGSAFLAAVAQDPELRTLKLIAEPWDIGPGGHRLGAFPAPWAEWNDRFRDQVRSFWRGDAGAAGDLADGLLGSARIFDRGGRAPWASVNFVACHDGFTLADLTMFNEKHNAANGEGNRDGHGHNLSDNLGVEGPSDDPAIAARRAQRQRTLLATALLAEGTPMLRAGDEVAQSQGGNNNAYCQDNATTWIDWAAGDRALQAFTARVLAVSVGVIRRSGRRGSGMGSRWRTGVPDVEWLGFDGAAPAWDGDALALILRGTGPAVVLALNAGDRARRLDVPGPGGWRRVLDTAAPDAPDAFQTPAAGALMVAPHSLAVFAEGDAP